MICRSFPVCSTQMERKKAGMKCVIFAGLPAAPELHSWWADADYVIAADAGYENACRVGVEPDLLLGDYDSAPRPEAGAKTVFLPAEKDDTDTYYAARKALELGATDVVIVGGLGGARLDHTLANLQTLVFLAKNGVCATLADTDNEVTALLPGTHRIQARPGWYFSIFSGYLSVLCSSGAAHGVTLSNLKYPLTDYNMTSSFPIGVSNEFAAETATLRFSAGMIYLVLSRKEPPRG